MTPSADTAATRLATRLAFFAAGFAMSCWAPLVPFAKANVGAGDAQLGLLLLCLGIGSLLAMPVTGWISAQLGARSMILTGGIGMVLCLPPLVAVGEAWLLAGALLLFGASLGTIDVAMNVHAVEVEKAARRPLMSGFHALFSVGGFAGAGGMTLLLSQEVPPTAAAICGSAVALAAVLLAGPRLLKARAGEPPAFVRPRGLVLLLAALTAVTFLVEGALLDWSALLIVGRDLLEPAKGGLGYMLFSVAMTLGRLTGDRVVLALGDRRVLVLGGILALLGFVLMLLAEWTPLAMAGFVLIGLGAANLVPVLFSLAGRQTAMPAGLAVAAVTTTGYAGILAGPALVGFVAQATSLSAAFWMLAAMMALLPIFARVVARG
ncbi:MFS transporter [Cereibacter sphaeroides]|uniref:MFS transporter n=1 Tax=Cereibacter sphaeroides TaxID=1063 RepID=UPI001F48287C|nr:MFS transporter [Cereibacter sphaeroides]MCE6960817.1 MFS transporter [Cereibacter sphaeroides]MCE6974305.1 MFS transporter [Cereibacter sphaeroides]